MADRETVITHLMIIHTWASFARERDLQFFTEKHLEDITQWTDDALKLLKKQESVVPMPAGDHGRMIIRRTFEEIMKCDRCPYQPERSEAGDYPDCFAGEEDQMEFKDGSYGCRFTRKQLDRMQEEYSEYLGDMGTDMGVEDDFRNKGWNLQTALSNMMHMVGMWPEGVRHTYKRHGKIFYRPYRNCWAGANKYLDYFSGALGITEKTEPTAPEKLPCYRLTNYGLRFLGRHIGVTIYPEED